MKPADEGVLESTSPNCIAAEPCVEPNFIVEPCDLTECANLAPIMELDGGSPYGAKPILVRRPLFEESAGERYPPTFIASKVVLS